MPMLSLMVGCLWLPMGKATAQQAPALAENPTGIHFFVGSWDEALAEAKRRHKPLFVDVYTTWCPPCQRMAREAFPNETVGTKFNDLFINYQVNAEYGEGLMLTKRFTVASYPTALFVLPTGELVHRAVGYGGVRAMVQQADMVVRLPPVRRFRRQSPVVQE